MEIVETHKNEAQRKLEVLKQQPGISAKPASLEDYWSFVRKLKQVFENGSPVVREKILKRLIKRVEVDQGEVTIYYIVDSQLTGPSASLQDDIIDDEGPPDGGSSFFDFSGSKSLTNGRG